MAAVDASNPTPEPAPALPDFYTDPNAVLQDISAKWRHGQPPDYSKTRKYFAETKSKNHEAGSLPQLVENLVKNWEIEASFKVDVSDWRTVNHQRYTFSMGGGKPQPAEHMLKVGTYNAIIAPNEYYSPETSDFDGSHKTFKRMMPTFAWEVLDVYSGPPKVSFRWRHWGVMANDYVGFNDKGEKVRVKAHKGTISIEGVTVADVDENMRVVHLETWFDPMEMFRQVAREGGVTKAPASHGQAGESSASCPVMSMHTNSSGQNNDEVNETVKPAAGEDASEKRHSKTLSGSLRRWVDSFRQGSGSR